MNRDSPAASGPPSHAISYFRPAEALRDLVSGYHLYVVEPPAGTRHQDIFYPGWANVRFQLAGDRWSLTLGDSTVDPMPPATIFGPTSRVAASDCGRGMLVGAGLTPLGWHRLTRAPAVDFADRVAPLGDLLGPMTADQLHADLRSAGEAGFTQVFDAFFTARMARPRADDDRVRAIHALLAREEAISVGEAAAAVGLHPRSFNHLSRSAFGFGPKLLLRRARFLRSLMVLREPSHEPWARRIGADYHDHSHFIRDSHEFLGMTPSAFLALSKPMSDASTVVRNAVLGAPVQALSEPATG